VPGDTFTFKVQYHDPQGVEPTYVRLNLLRWDGSQYIEVTESPYEMTTTDTDFTKANYTVQAQRYRTGSYRYYFSASDGHGDAIGEPSWHRMLGRIVNGTRSASAQLKSLSCRPTSAGAQLTFVLSRGASVSAEVLNIAGRPVQVLVADRPMAAGAKTLVWAGRNASGALVPSGVYLVRITAGDEAGSQSQALATVRIGR